MKLKDLFNEQRYKSKLTRLPDRKKKPKAIVALRIKRVERGGGEVTNQELINIFKSADFPARFRTSRYVYQVELKKTRDNKRVAIVNIFDVNNLPTDIDINTTADFDLDGAKVYLEVPDKVKNNTTEDEEQKKAEKERLAKAKAEAEALAATATQTNVDAEVDKKKDVKAKAEVATEIIYDPSKIKTVNNSVKVFQQKIINKLGSDLKAAKIPVYQTFMKYGADGKYGPATKNLIHFLEIFYDLPSTKGTKITAELQNKLG